MAQWLELGVRVRVETWDENASIVNPTPDKPTPKNPAGSASSSRFSEEDIYEGDTELDEEEHDKDIIGTLYHNTVEFFGRLSASAYDIKY